MPTARRRKPTETLEFPPLQPISLSDLENSLKLPHNPPKKANASPFSKEMIRRNVTFLVRAENCLDVSAKIDDILSQSPLKPPKTATREFFAGIYKHFRPDYPSPAEAKALKEKARLENEKDEYFDELLKEWERTTMLAGQAAPPVIAWVEQRGHDPMVIRRLLAALEHPGGFTAHGRALLSDLEALFDTIFSGKPSWLSARQLRRQTRKKGAGLRPRLLTGYLSPGELAKIHNLPLGALRARLKRWRKSHFEGWIENTNSKPREAVILYQPAAVADVIEGMTAASSERPAK